MTSLYHRMEAFDWTLAPLGASSLSQVVCVSSLYVLFILIHTTSAHCRQLCLLKDIKVFIPAHNLVLCGASLGIFVGCLYEVIQRCINEGSIVWMFCEHASTKPTGPLFFYSYLYYLSKYYELLDTFLQLFLGNTPPNYFLHVYHHSLVIVMCWVWLDSVASLQFTGLLFNTAVHVVMYYYFYLKSIGINPWWKKAVTTFQIIQFGTSLVCVSTTLYITWLRHSDEQGEQCKGLMVVLGQVVFNITLLYGFIGLLTKSAKVKGKLL